MNKKRKKGFTLAEMVIVMAVIAILAAVLIPTLTDVFSSTNISSDVLLVEALNTAIASDGRTNRTMYEALQAAEEGGYPVRKIRAVTDNVRILWDSVHDVFCLYYPSSEHPDGIDYVFDYEPETRPTAVSYWAIYDGEEDLPEELTYSVYWNNTEQAFSRSLTTGFDAGRNTLPFTLEYVGTDAPQRVMIRTNRQSLTVGDTQDRIRLYGVTDELNVQSVDTIDGLYVYGFIHNISSFDAGSLFAGRNAVFTQTADEIRLLLPDGRYQEESGVAYGEHYYAGSEQCLFCEQDKHVHTYEEIVIRPATCTEEGEKQITCTQCDYSEIAAIPATGHTYGEWIVGTDATTTTTGTAGHYHCNVCGADFNADRSTLADLTIPARTESVVQTLAQGERVYRIGVNNLYQDGASTPAGILRHTEDEGFTVVRTNGGVDDSVCAAFTVPTEVLQELPFLVIETDAAASSGLSLDFVGQDTSLITCSTGKITGWTGRTVFHLGGLCRTGITCQLRCCGTEGQALSLTACYLTDSPCAVTFFGWDCADPLADDTPSDNVNSSVYGVDGLGMTAAGPWKTEDGLGYFYAYISQEQIGRTPYLVMKVNGEDISNLSHIFGLYAGDEFDLRLHSFAAGPQLQIVDLRTFGRAVRLRVTMTGDVRFTLLYLTQDLSTVIDRGAPGTPGFVAAADLTPVPGMDKNTVVKIGEYGVMYTPSDPVSDVNGASYYVLAGPTVRAYPYLVYQFGTASAVPSVFGVYGPDWEQNGTVLPAGDTERHVIDLRSLPAYRNGGEIRLQFRFDTETTFDELYLTAE